MPVDVICEDAWLSFLLGRRRYAICPMAKVFYTYPKAADLVPLYKRIIRGQRQMKRRYAGHCSERRESAGERIASWIRELRSDRSWRSRAAQLYHLFVRTVVRCGVALLLVGEPLVGSRRGWRVAKSSKVPPRV